MQVIMFAIITLFLSSVVSFAQHAQVLDCDVSLFKQIESENVSSSEIIFFLDLVTQENFASMQHEFKSSWDGPYGFFKTDYNDLKLKRETFRKEVQYRSDKKYSRDYAISKLTNTGLEAYKACLLTKSPPSNSLNLYLDPQTSFDRIVTVVVAFQTNLELSSKVLSVEVFGGRLVTDRRSRTFVEKSIKVSGGNPTTITIGHPIGHTPFNFQRTSPAEEFRVIANIAGMPPALLTIPPALKKRIEVTSRRVPQQSGSFMVRGIQDGGGRGIFSYDTGRGEAALAERETFNGNACVCASGEREVGTKGGRCVAPTNFVDSGELDSASVRFTSTPLQNCGGSNQAATRTIETPHEVCHTVVISLNAPNLCRIDWSIGGVVKQQREVFVNK